jgi:DNA-binding MarR family transcriptional regulator
MSSAHAADVARDLKVVFGRLRRRLREVADADDLTPSQASALSRLLRTGPDTASGLASADGVRPQSMAATLAPLEQRGFVRRDQDPDDGRRQLVSLTDAGRERAEGTRQAREEWLTRALQEYTEAERRTIADALTLLDKLTES